jgi:hypothetical protein
MQQKPLTQALITGFVSLACGVTVSSLSPINKTFSALAGSVLGATGITYFIRRTEDGDVSKTSILPSFAERIPTKAIDSNVVINPSKLNVVNVQKNNFISVVQTTAFGELISELGKRKIEIKSTCKQLEENDFFEIAFFLGESYNSLASLYRKMKSSISSEQRGQKEFTYVLSSNEDNNQVILQFRQLLEEKGVWTSRYIRSEKIIRFNAPNGDSNIRGFFEGKWLEIFVVYKITEFLATFPELKYQYVINPQISYLSEPIIDKKVNKTYELDALFLINNQLLLVETKTGEKGNLDLNQVIEHAKKKRLSLPKQRVLLVATALSDRETANWNQNHSSVTITNLNNFLDCLRNSLGLSNLSDKEDFDRAFLYSTEKFFKLLKDKKLRPLPIYRKSIIEELVRMFENYPQPMTFYEVKKKIAETLQISNSITEEVLNAVRHSKSLLKDNGEIVYQFSEPISALISYDSILLEKKCIEVYAATTLSSDRNYFERPENIRVFEETVGASIPDRETIEQIKKTMSNS